MLHVYLMGLLPILFGTLIFLGWCDADKDFELTYDYILSMSIIATCTAIAWPVCIVVGVVVLLAISPIKFGNWLGRKKK